MQNNLYTIFKSNFPTQENSPFIELPSGHRYTYDDIESFSARLAHRLIKAGATPGDRVMVQVEKSPIAIFLYLACLRAGLIYLPLNTGYKSDELDYLWQDSEPKVIVCSPKSPLAAKAGEGPSKSIVFTLDNEEAGSLTENLGHLPDEFQTSDVAYDDIAAILYTSGTTGRPKGAMITHQNLASNASALHEKWGFDDNDVLLHALPIFHTHGLFVATNCTLMNGTSMLFLPRFDLEEVIRLLPRATVMMGVPTFYTRLLQSPDFTADLCKSIRLFISGSAPLTSETFKDFFDRTDHTILERYGMTETNMITSNPLNHQRIPGSVGHPLPGVSVRITDDNGDMLTAGSIGNIEVRGPNVFKGYWRNPEKTKEEFCNDGFFKTGDVGEIDNDGYLHIVGRSKDLIISGGFNVYPKEVEEVIDRIDGVQESAVIGVPHPDYGEGVVAITVINPKHKDSLNADKIKHITKKHLASYKVPKTVITVDSIPKNVMGKVEKKKLRDQYNSFFKSA